MSTASQNNDNQEIDLSQISKKIGDFFEGISTQIFKVILFFKRNILWVGTLFIVGAALGFYLDRTSQAYNNEIIVTPNFGSNDYLYSKVELLGSKISENDTVFLKDLGFKNAQRIVKIEIEPIVDVYKFIDNKTTNFELIKLMAEDGELSKIVKDNMTSKNYPFHSIKMVTTKKQSNADLITPLMNYLNDSDYFKKIQKEALNNVRVKMTENDSIIQQINGVLNNIVNTTGSTKSNSLVYYNDNMQLNDIIKTKEVLVTEQGTHRVEFINYDKIVKDISIVTNVKNTTGTNGRMKFVLPLLFIGLFVVVSLFVSFYRNQLAKSRI